MADRPDDVLYTETHEWIRLVDDIATVGLTDFAVEHLGELVFVDLPDVGQDVEAGELICEVESVKAVGEINSPFEGEVVETNEGLADDQTPLTSDCFESGWLFKIKVKDPEATGGFTDLAAYEAGLGPEAS